jgi:phospholipid/cholesterol/gamma-HCH transport system substrate-binding protein
MKRISPEVWVALLSVASISILLFGLRFLKGSTVLSGNVILLAKYEQVSGLKRGAKVLYKGFKIGYVGDITANTSEDKLLVELVLTEPVSLPTDSKAVIEAVDVLGTMAVQVIPGKATTTLASGQMITGNVATGMVQRLETELIPLKNKIQETVSELDFTIHSINSIFRDSVRWKAMVADINQITHHLAQTTQGTAQLVGQLQASARAFGHLIETVDKNSPQIEKILSGTGQLTDSLGQSILQTNRLLRSAAGLTQQLETTVTQINRGQGSIGKLMATDSLHTNLNQSLQSLDKLLTDFRLYPKRYFHFSVFGRKSKLPAP